MTPTPRTAPLQHWPVHTLPLPCHECGEGLNALEAIRFRAAHDNAMGQQQADRDWLLRRIEEAQAAPPDALREALRAECRDCRTPEQNALRNGYTCPRHFDVINSYPMPTLGDLAASPTPTYTEVERLDRPGNRANLAASPSAAPATLPAIDTRIVWKRDHGMVIVTGDEEPQSLEIPAWAVRTIFDVAGKDPEEEARKVSAFINAHTGLDVERLARAYHSTVHGGGFDLDVCLRAAEDRATAKMLVRRYEVAAAYDAERQGE